MGDFVKCAALNLEKSASVIPLWDYSSSFKPLLSSCSVDMVSLIRNKNGVLMSENTWDMTLMCRKKLRQLSLA